MMNLNCINLDVELTEIERHNMASIFLEAAANPQYSVKTILDRQQRLAERDRQSRAEKGKIYLAQAAEIYAAYVISFDLPENRAMIRSAFALDKGKTSSRWLNWLIKAFTGCATRVASRRALVIKLALHHGIQVADFEAFFIARGNEAKCVSEYKQITRQNRDNADVVHEQDPPETTAGQVRNSQPAEGKESPETRGKPLLVCQPKVVVPAGSAVTGREFTVLLGNPTVIEQIAAARHEGSKTRVGTMRELRVLFDKVGAVVLKVQRGKL